MKEGDIIRYNQDITFGFIVEIDEDMVHIHWNDRSLTDSYSRYTINMALKNNYITHIRSSLLSKFIFRSGG